MDDERRRSAQEPAWSARSPGGWELAGLGSLLVGSVVLWTLVGLIVDARADTSPVFVLAGLALGIVLGVVLVWRKVAPYLRG